jgi:hypothetical protein
VLARQTLSTEVVGGGDELPFGLAGGQAAALESVDAAQELGVGEDRFDDLLSASVERASLVAVEDLLDPFGLVALARREPSWFGALGVLGREQDVNAERLAELTRLDAQHEEPDARVGDLALRRTIRLPMVGSATRNARAISPVVMPPSARSVSATRAGISSAG